MCTHCEQPADLPAVEYLGAAKTPKKRRPRILNRRHKAVRAGKRRLTHEQYVASIVGVLLKQPGVTDADRKAISLAKVTYGGGEMGVRGITWYDKWAHKPVGKAKPVKGHFVGINATWQKTAVELAETVAHEIG